MYLQNSRLRLIKNQLKTNGNDTEAKEKTDIQKKYLENSLIFNGFYKKTFKERINQVNYIEIN